MAGKELPRQLTGTIVWINRAHRFFLVEAPLHDRFILRECFHY